MNARRCPERANLKPFRGSVAQVASRDFNAITCHNARHISPGHFAARKTSWRQSMSVTKTQVLEELRRVKGPDLEGNIVDLGLVSEILIKDERVYFSITVPPERAHELEPLRQAAEKVVKEIPGVAGVTAVLTAETSGGGRPPAGAGRPNVVEHPRVQQAQAAQAAPGGPRPQPGAGRQTVGVPGVKHLVAVASGKGGVGKST